MSSSGNAGDDRPEIVATFFGIDVPSAPHLTPRMIRSMQEGRYEGGEVRTALANVRPGDRVLELGAGSGAVGAAIARNCRPDRMMSFEANPRLIPHARALHARNGLAGTIELRHGVVLAEPDAPAAITFMLRGNFLGSALADVAAPGKAEPVEVPVTRYADLAREFPHEVIVMDIEGGEMGFLEHADLSAVRAVLVELHPKVYGREGLRACRQALARQGLELDPETTQRGVSVFRRADATRPAVTDGPDDEMDETTAAPAEKAKGAAAPPEVADAATAVTKDTFLLRGGLVDAWFQRRSDTLLVTFDNLASVGQYDPPQPWLHIRAERAGLSILGIMASRKDWYRNADTPALLGALRDAGLFGQFRRVVLTGTSMGGFAALTYAPLVPGCAVLAFSPQTSLSRKIAPFERRFPYGLRKWDWKTPAFLDAAEGAAAASEVWLCYDPFDATDKAHAARLSHLPSVRPLRCDHFGHRAIRMVGALGALDLLVAGVTRGDLDTMAFWRALRARRDHRRWRRALMGDLSGRNHPRLLGWLTAASGAKAPRPAMEHPSERDNDE